MGAEILAHCRSLTAGLILLLFLSPARAAEPAEDGQWTMPAKNPESTRFSGLDQINTNNAAKLKVAWGFSTGVTRGHEAAPLVVNGTMYLVTPYPNVVYALGLTPGGYTNAWKFEPKPASAAQGVACCDVVNRGLCFDDGRIVIRPGSDLKGVLPKS